MRIRTRVLPLLMLLCLASPAFAQDSPKPETIVGKMAFKFVRGVTNVGTSIVEIPKQTILNARDRGPVGYVVGPLAGIGMTFYRVVIGAAEAVFCMVPQPGYYDPMIDPEFVWQGWQEMRKEPITDNETESPAPAN